MALILLVENDQSLAETWKRALAGAGHEVQVSPDVATALDIADMAPPEVAITEILLPGLGGIAFTGRVKLRDPSIKVIAVTGDPAALDPSVGALSLARRVGADLLMEKPIETAALIEAVNGLLSEDRTV